jgi:hypothetical protein
MSTFQWARKGGFSLLLITLSSVLATSARAAAGPHDPAAAVMAHAKAQAAAMRARAQAGGALDNTPPVLAKFALVGSVDAQQQGAAAIADMAVTDDLSGVQFVTLTLTSPSGAQSVSLYNILSSGARKYAGSFAVGSQDLLDFGGRFTRFSEPGTWTATSMLIADVNGNIAIYGAGDLAALGNAAVEVKNDGGYDVTPPAVASGQIVTRQVSLSRPPAGTAAGTAPFIDAALIVTDAGNGAVAGPTVASMSFCLPDQWGNCQDTIELDGTADAAHLAKTTLRMSGSPHPGQLTGKYGLYQVFVQDAAGNLVVVSTGLSELFPKGMVINVLP